MFALPGHALGKLERSLDFIEQGAIPVVLQDSKAPLDGVVLAVIRRVILQRKVALLRKVGHDYVILRLRRCDGRRPSRARVRLRCER